MKKGNNRTLRILGICLILLMMASSIKVVFANGDIAFLLGKWFNDKQSTSLQEIETAISLEQARQTSRLKNEIHNAIQAAEQEYQLFLRNEKENLVQRLDDYAEKLISNYDVNIETNEAVISKLECLATKAQVEMDIVLGLKDPSQLINCGEVTTEVRDSIEKPDTGEETNAEEEHPVKNESNTEMEVK
ncbi:hypothetical protein [Ornithinibacillus sp. 179-J 7C1 HS]|uniref:hypothetical protein n=1 Tax=Ornithinibacillus sp. 179-J 7C1 HS TaxID=3142384 RepID=UPI0039A028CD